MKLGEFEFDARKRMRKEFVNELGFDFKSKAFVKWALRTL